MCGIFGILLNPKTSIKEKDLVKTLHLLAKLSESRGKDSSGLAFRNMHQKSIEVIKGDIPVTRLIKNRLYLDHLDAALDAYKQGAGFNVFGHARLVTNGSQLQEVNNQPVIKDDILIIHNGIIVNVDELWKQNTEIKRNYNIDTEVIPSLIRNYLNSKKDLITSCNEAMDKLEGTFSTAMMLSDYDEFVLATNNGSLYYITDNKDYFVFSSESYFLNQLKKTSFFRSFGEKQDIFPLVSNQGLLVNMSTLKINSYSLRTKDNISFIATSNPPLTINKINIENNDSKNEVIIDPSIYIDRSKEMNLYNLLEDNHQAIKKLKRCTKCLLPQTFPFIVFDEAGVCNYCKNYQPKNKYSTLDKLMELVEPYRSPEGKSDCIVPFSGGRDSTYTLHVVKEVLGLNPIAFTYDWGMVTDLARRNIARVCGKLGVENIIVSADIRWKRENIRKNIRAWLKNPQLGMIPLFMAGDKYFFYYTNQVKKRTSIKLNIWGINHLENTEFKTGFAGLQPKFDKQRIYSLSKVNQLKLFGFVAGNVIKNPNYLNQSVFDSLGSFATRYIAPKRDYYHLFDYYKWDEKEITDLITNDYQWERAIDTSSTWRIGDGTASFYNYIYYTVAGFSEIDTFRSNQIREGMIDRETALKLVEEENRPRYETMRWYFEIIGLDFKEVITIINKIPKLYEF